MAAIALLDRKPSQIVDDGFAALALAIAATGDNSDVVNAVSVQQLQEHAPFRIDRSYCVKTGADLGERRIDQLGQWIDAAGMQRAARILPFLLQTAVHPLWIETNGEALDIAEQADPCGYFVYSATHALMLHYKEYNSFDRTWKSPEAQLRWLADKITLRAWLETKPLDEIRERNAVWRIYNRLIQPRYAPLAITRLADIACPVIWAELIKSIRDVMTAFAKRHHHQLSPLIYRQLYQDQLAYEAVKRIKPDAPAMHGHSAIGKQRRFKAGTIATEIAFFETLEQQNTTAIDALFSQFGVTKNFVPMTGNAAVQEQTRQSQATPKGGFKSTPGLLNRLLETATAPTAPSGATPSAQESFTSLAKKLSSAVEGEFKLRLGSIKKG